MSNKQEEITEILENAKEAIAHNFISPLNALDYYIDALRDNNEDKEIIEQKYLKAQECLRSLYSRINHLNEILKNF